MASALAAPEQKVTSGKVLGLAKTVGVDVALSRLQHGAYKHYDEKPRVHGGVNGTCEQVERIVGAIMHPYNLLGYDLICEQRQHAERKQYEAERVDFGVLGFQTLVFRTCIFAPFLHDFHVLHFHGSLLKEEGVGVGVTVVFPKQIVQGDVQRFADSHA